MIKDPSLFSDIKKQLAEGFTSLSGTVAELKRLAEKGEVEGLNSTVDRLFKSFMEHHRILNAQIANLESDYSKQDERVRGIAGEREQFKALYNTGLVMNSKEELQALIEFGMDQMTYHLRADRGFLILVNSAGDREYFVSRNFHGEVIDEPALQVSSTVIRKTVDALRPMRIDEESGDDSVLKHGSFVRLGLQSVLCVPIFWRRQLLGVIYLDRTQGSESFKETDLTFLLAFSKQIASRINELRESFNLKTEYERRDRDRLNELREKYDFKEIVGKSEKLVSVLELAAKVAATEVPVMILGESGTGKELIARALHFNSDRFENRFVAINCGAIPSELLESELFGYEPGAFTGAVKSKVGKFEAAHKGTLFLDEVAELSLNLQAKILRAVQTKEFERLGSTDTRKIDVRIIAATNKDLQALIAEKKFREDLYYRLKVVEIQLPALRDRPEDIGILVQHFMQKYANGSIVEIEDDALDVLERYRWDGNIRELENVIQRSIILCNGQTVQIEDLPPEIIAKSEGGYKIKYGVTLEEAEKDFRRWYIRRALSKFDNNKTRTAESLGVNRTHFFRMLAQLGLDK